jgi:hypothetical protein
MPHIFIYQRQSKIFQNHCSIKWNSIWKIDGRVSLCYPTVMKMLPYFEHAVKFIGQHPEGVTVDALDEHMKSTMGPATQDGTTFIQNLRSHLAKSKRVLYARRAPRPANGMNLDGTPYKTWCTKIYSLVQGEGFEPAGITLAKYRRQQDVTPPCRHGRLFSDSNLPPDTKTINVPVRKVSMIPSALRSDARQYRKLAQQLEDAADALSSPLFDGEFVNSFQI